MKISRKWSARVLLTVLLGTGSASAVANSTCSEYSWFGFAGILGFGECNVYVRNDTRTDIEVFVHYDDEKTGGKTLKGPFTIDVGDHVNLRDVHPTEWSGHPIFIRARNPSTGGEWGGRYRIDGHGFERCYLSKKHFDAAIWNVVVHDEKIECTKKWYRKSSNDNQSCRNQCGRAEDNCKLKNAHDYYRRQQCVSNARNCRRRC